MRGSSDRIVLLLSTLLLSASLLFSALIVADTGVRMAREQEAVYYRLMQAVPIKQKNQSFDF